MRYVLSNHPIHPVANINLLISLSLSFSQSLSPLSNSLSPLANYLLLSISLPQSRSLSPCLNLSPSIPLSSQYIFLPHIIYLAPKHTHMYAHQSTHISHSYTCTHIRMCSPTHAHTPESFLPADTIPGRQCMASCFFLLRQFDDVLIYLNSVKVSSCSNATLNRVRRISCSNAALDRVCRLRGGHDRDVLSCSCLFYRVMQDANLT